MLIYSVMLLKYNDKYGHYTEILFVQKMNGKMLYANGRDS